MFHLSRDNKLLSIAILLWGCGDGLYLYIWPLYIASLGADPVQIGLVLSIGTLAIAVSYIPGGFLADRFGRRRTMLWSWIIGVIAMPLIAMARDWHQLLPGILLRSLSAFSMPAISSYVVTASEDRDLERTYSLVISSSWSLGTLLTPSIGGWLADSLGMRPLFLLAFALYILSTFFIFLLSEQPIVPAPEGSGYGRILSHPLLLASTIFFLVTFILYLGQPLAPNYLEEVVGLNLSWIGTLGTFASLGSAVLAAWLGHLATWGIFISEALCALSFLLLLWGRTFPLLALSFFLRGSLSACTSLAAAQIARILGEDEVGRGFGVFNTLVSLAYALAPYAAGQLYSFSPTLPLLVSLGLTPLAMALTALVRKEREPRG